MKNILILILASVGIFGSTAAETLHVPGDYASIQEAVDAAIDGDTIEVSPGVYEGGIEIFDKAVTIIAPLGPEVTIVDCQQQTRGFYFWRHENEQPVIDGFQIQNGNAGDGGGGIKCRTSSPMIRNCIIENCTGFEYGGGIVLTESSAWIVNCIIRNNLCYNDISNLSAYGGGVCSLSSTPVIINTLICDNTSQGFPQFGTSGYAGGLYLSSTAQIAEQPVMINCTVANNHVINGNGDGVWSAWCEPVISNCIFWGHIEDYIGSNQNITFSTMADNNAWGGNLSLDPLFTSEGSFDYLISHSDAGQVEDSPCIDAGNNFADLTCFHGLERMICLNELTTRTDGLTDSGMVDMGFHYTFDYPSPPSPTPAATATPEPTSSPTPASTETPEPTPTTSATPEPTPPDGLKVRLSLPSLPLTGGETAWVDAHIDNHTNQTLESLCLFCAIQVSDSFWFYPEWATDPSWQVLDELSPGLNTETILPEFIWPETKSQGFVTMWAALSNPDMTHLLGDYDIQVLHWR